MITASTSAKPDAPPEIRGSFGTIASKTSGFAVGELMPQTARLTDKIAVLRAVVTGDNAHSSSGYQMLTGMPHLPLNQESAVPKAPNLSPSLGAIVRALRPNPGQLPSAVTLISTGSEVSIAVEESPSAAHCERTGPSQ